MPIRHVVEPGLEAEPDSSANMFIVWIRPIQALWWRKVQSRCGWNCSPNDYCINNINLMMVQEVLGMVFSYSVSGL